jgi:hypothetical protein
MIRKAKAWLIVYFEVKGVSADTGHPIILIGAEGSKSALAPLVVQVQVKIYKYLLNR